MTRLGVTYADDALLHRIAERTGGYPSFVQLLCDTLLKTLEGGHFTITEATLQAAERNPEFVEELRNILNVSDAGQLMAHRLAQTDRFNLETADRTLADTTGRTVPVEVTEALLQEMTLFGVLARDEDNKTYAWAIPLIREVVDAEDQYGLDRRKANLPEDPKRWSKLLL